MMVRFVKWLYGMREELYYCEHCKCNVPLAHFLTCKGV